MQIIIIIIQLIFLHRLKYHNHNQKSERVQSSFNEREGTLEEQKKTKRQRKLK